MNSNILVLGCVAALAMSSPSLAHHSFAMFDADKTVELEGTVKEFQWTNPHSWLQVVVIDEAGQQVEWSLEMGSPGSLARKGWRPRTLNPGDKISFSMHPLKDGSSGGQFLSAALPDGTVLGE